MLSRQTIWAFLRLALRLLIMLQVPHVGVTAEESSIMDPASHIDPGGKLYSATCPTQDVKDFLIGPNSNRWAYTIAT